LCLCSFLRRDSGEGGADLFSLVSSDKTHGNGSKLQQERFRLDVRKRFITERVVKHWKRLPKEVVRPQACQCSRGIWTIPLIIFIQPGSGQAVGLDDHYMSLPTEIFYSILFYSILFYSILLII